MSKENEFRQALYALRYNYPNQETTWGRCCTESCSEGARGSGKCPSCCEDKLAEIIGDEIIAMNIHEAIKDQSFAINDALDLLENTENERPNS